MGTMASTKALILLSITASLSLSQAADYHDAGLQEHNKYRKLHKSPDMELVPNLNNQAAACAQYYLDLGQIDHSCPNKGHVGENLYISDGYGSDLVQQVKTACKGWYDEIKDYDFDNPGNFPSGTQVGHFTQLVWKGSTRLGIGAVLSGRKCVVVALYEPPGNIQRADGNTWEFYKTNVLPSRGSLLTVTLLSQFSAVLSLSTIFLSHFCQ